MNAWFQSEFSQQVLQPGVTEYIAIVNWLKENFINFEFNEERKSILDYFTSDWKMIEYLNSNYLNKNYFNRKHKITGAVEGLKIDQFKEVDSQARLLLACFEADTTAGLVVKYLLENEKTPQNNRLPTWQNRKVLFRKIWEINTNPDNQKDISLIYYLLTDDFWSKTIFDPTEDNVVLDSFILSWIIKNYNEKRELTLQQKLDLITIVRMAQRSPTDKNIQHYGIYLSSFVFLFVNYYQENETAEYQNPFQANVERHLNKLWNNIFETYQRTDSQTNWSASISEFFENYEWLLQHMKPFVIQHYGKVDSIEDVKQKLIEHFSSNFDSFDKESMAIQKKKISNESDLKDVFTWEATTSEAYQNFIRTKMVITLMMHASLQTSSQ